VGLTAARHVDSHQFSKRFCGGLTRGHRASATVAFDHAIIAGNGGREAARAVTEAIPYLRKAETVSVLVIDDGKLIEDQATIGEDLIEHLLHHGLGAAGLRHVRKTIVSGQR
jgi:hypothetical protein